MSAIGARRRAGVLLHPTSLPGTLAVGDLGPSAHAFLDWLAEAGLSAWQLLPLGPTGYGESPYTPLSAFAGNPLVISPEALVTDGLLSPEEIGAGTATTSPRIDFRAASERRNRLIRLAWGRFRESRSANLVPLWESFRERPETRAWLDPWTLFAAIKQESGGGPWTRWDEALRRRRKRALADARRRLAPEIERLAFEQFLFDRQWSDLRAAAEARGIELIGDVPIYVPLDSAEVWSRRELFSVDRDGRAAAVAGVPPDYFSSTGQLWGHPLYRWRKHAELGYDWWIARVRRQLELSHRVRLDHFRGFVAYWRVAAGAATAEGGRWVPGPGAALFEALRGSLGELPLIAEDLGQIDEPVHDLRRTLGLPGMRVLQFGFDEIDSLHAPHRHATDTVVYTGTHDNDTCRGWFDGASQEVRKRALDYLGATPETLPSAMVRAAFTSVAETAIVPLQDLLGLGSDARMNTPGRESGNWSWRVDPAAVPADLPRRLRDLAEVSARTSRPAPDPQKPS